MPLSPSLLDPAARSTLIARIRALTPNAPRQWGRMSVTQMLWHVAETYRVALGDIHEPDRSNWFFRSIVRRIAFHTPFAWPKNSATLPRFDAVRQSPAIPESFAQQIESVVALVERFAIWNGEGHKHPLFGPLTQSEWQHWGWRHTDHHLRQFGA